jgi:serine/threonine protein kinase
MDSAPRVLANRYRLEATIGRGGMGIVHRAIDQQLERAVAVKVLSEGHDELAFERFQVEAKRTAAVRHPNIVEVFDVGRDGDDGFLVMELLQGETLADTLKSRTALPAVEAVAIASQICEALTAAHDAGLVHRDLKPANVFLVPNAEGPPRVKLLDFGIAKRIEGATARTDPNMIIGTLEYLSPEQVRGAQLDGRADLYALGMTLYRMLTGELPFQADNVAALIHKHLMVAPVSLRACAPDRAIPPALDAAVLKLLAKEAKGRPASARDARRELLASLLAQNATERQSRPDLLVEEPPRGTGERVLDFDDAPPGSKELELDLRGSAPRYVVEDRPVAPIVPVSRFGMEGMQEQRSFEPAPAPLPGWLVPLAQVPEAWSKRVAGYSFFAFLLYLVFFSAHLVPSIGLLLLGSIASVSFWANRRAAR